MSTNKSTSGLVAVEESLWILRNFLEIWEIWKIFVELNVSTYTKEFKGGSGLFWSLC